MREAKIPGVIVAVATAGTLYCWAVFALTPTHPGAIGLNMNALGTDWMAFWGAAQWYFAGHLGALFDSARFTDYLNQTFAGALSHPMPYRPWLYPPSYLLVLLPFGLLPFALSYAGFQLFTAALLAGALWFGDLRPRARMFVIAAALLSPAAADNVAMGQNAFLSAALLVGGLRLLSRRPALAGAVLGLLTIKPQLWLLVPVALAAGREWKALFWSLATGAALGLASLALFGPDLWRQWLALALGGGSDGNAPWVELIREWGDSIYACLVASGASPALADALQAIGTVVGLALAYIGLRCDLPRERQIALVLAAAIFAAPHSAFYEGVLLAVAATLWAAAEHRASLAQWTLALAMWLAPIFNPPAVSVAGRLTPLLILGFIAMVLTGTRRQSDHAADAAAFVSAATRGPASEPL